MPLEVLCFPLDDTVDSAGLGARWEVADGDADLDHFPLDKLLPDDAMEQEYCISVASNIEQIYCISVASNMQQEYCISVVSNIQQMMLWNKIVINRSIEYLL